MRRAAAPEEPAPADSWRDREPYEKRGTRSSLAPGYTLHALLKVVHQTTDEEVEYAKAQLKTNYLSSISSIAGANDSLGRQMLTYGRVMPPAEFFARVDALGVADVKAVADQVVNDQDHALAAVGPLHELPDYNWIRRRSYWLRY